MRYKTIPYVVAKSMGEALEQLMLRRGVCPRAMISPELAVEITQTLAVSRP
jgi:hypothetical protein